jgi:hypothetical protein
MEKRALGVSVRSTHTSTGHSLLNLYTVVAIMLLLPLGSFAQQSDSLNWFPYKTGDMWEYWVTDGVLVDTAQIITVKDAASSDGIIHVTQQRRLINPIEYHSFLDSLTFAFDTSNSEVRGTYDAFPYLGPVLLYRFSAQQGDEWLVDSSGEMALVTKIYQGSVFGVPTTFMEIRYHSGVTRFYDTIARGFGLVERYPTEGGWWYRVKGAVIDGRLYGDTTRVVTSVQLDPYPVLPYTLTLNQNYPNPFNTSTVISFVLSNSEYVSVTIYDLMGRESRRLICNQKLSIGLHTVVWDGTTTGGQQAASGVYYCRLSNSKAVTTRSMTLLK